MVVHMFGPQAKTLRWVRVDREEDNSQTHSAGQVCSTNATMHTPTTAFSTLHYQPWLTFSPNLQNACLDLEEAVWGNVVLALYDAPVALLVEKATMNQLLTVRLHRALDDRGEAALCTYAPSRWRLCPSMCHVGST